LPKYKSVDEGVYSWPESVLSLQVWVLADYGSLKLRLVTAKKTSGGLCSALSSDGPDSFGFPMLLTFASWIRTVGEMVLVLVLRITLHEAYDAS